MKGWERIKYIMETERLNKNSLSFAIGLSNNVTIGRIINEKREPSIQTFKKIINAFPKYNPNWILTGEGDILKSDYSLTEESSTSLAEPPSEYRSNAERVYLREKPEKVYLETKPGVKYYEIGDGKFKMRVPLVPFDAYARFANEYYSPEADREEWEERDFVVGQIGHGKYVAFEVKGDSMDDGTRKSFGHGDIVLTRQLDMSHWKAGLKYNKYPFWVIVSHGSVLIKQIIDQDLETGDIRCHSLNPSPEYTDFTVNLSDVKLLFNVIQIKHQDTFI